MVQAEFSALHPCSFRGLVPLVLVFHTSIGQDLRRATNSHTRHLGISKSCGPVEHLSGQNAWLFDFFGHPIAEDYWLWGEHCGTCRSLNL